MGTNDTNDKLTVTELINTMKGKNFTNGWDIACAYDIEILNKILLEIYNDPKSKKIVKLIKLGSKDNPYSITYAVINAPGFLQGLSMSITENYTFELSEPVLQFLDVNNVANLSMPIKSSKVVTTDATLKLLNPQPTNTSELTEPNKWFKMDSGKFVLATVDEVDQAIGNETKALEFYIRVNNSALDGKDVYQNKVYQLLHLEKEQTKSPLEEDKNTYVLEAIVPIVAIKGDTQVTTGNNIVIFDKDSEGKADIVLHFQTEVGSGTEFTLYKEGVKDSPTLLDKAPDILDRIKNYFAEKVGDIDYRLATVKNTIPNKNNINVTPKSFRFATQQKGTNGTLTVFIQTQESGLPAGSANLTFEDNRNQPFLPVTTQSNTTLIFSRGFMCNYYLVTGLGANQFNPVNGKGTDNEPITVEGTYNHQVPISITGIEVPYSPFKDVDSVTVDPVILDKFDLTLTFTPDKGLHIQSSICKSTTVYLHHPMSCIPNMGGGEIASCHDPYDEPHNVTITATVDKTVSVQWSESSTELSLEFDIKKEDYKIFVDSDISDQCGTKNRRNIHDQIKNKLGDAMPSISIPINSLNAVAEENLLFDGQQLFTLDKSLGIFSPQDIVVFGNIKSLVHNHFGKQK